MPAISQSQAQLSATAAERMKALLLVAVTLPTVSWVMAAVSALVGTEWAPGMLLGMAAMTWAVLGGIISLVMSLGVIVGAIQRSEKDVDFARTFWCTLAVGAIVFATGTGVGLATLAT